MAVTEASGSLHERSLESWQRHLDRRRPVSAGALRRALARGTLASVAERTLATRASEALLSVDGEPATGAELLTRSAAFAGAVAQCSGRRVLLAMPASLDFVAAYLGVLRAGSPAILANPSLTRPELERLVEAGGAAYGIVSPAVAEALGLAASSRPIGTASLLVTFDTSPGRERPRADGSDRAPRPSDEAVLAHTSGSTGQPKGVPLSHANLLSSMRAVMAAWRWSPGDVVVHCLPLFHQHGLGSIHALLLGGGRTVISSRFDPGELAATVAAEEASVLLAVPAIYRRLVEASPDRSLFRSLRLAVSGSAPLPPTLFERVSEVTGQVPLERYGMTESGLDISNLYGGRRKAGAVGFALPGVEVAVADPRGEGEAAPGEDGEILLRGPQVFSGYLGGSGRDVFEPPGWLHTGDVGRVDPDDGSISITGRSKDLIISGGLNVYPREVELVIEQHPAVAAVAVGGVSSERWGEAVCAFVVARPGGRPSREELDALCRGSLAPYKHPKQFVLVHDLPRNEMGKVLRHALAELAASGEALG